MRVAYFTAGTIGVGHYVRAAAIQRALQRNDVRAEFRSFRPVVGAGRPALRDEVRVPILREQLSDPTRAVESALYRSLRAYGPDLLLVDMFWSPLHHVLARLQCESWLLLRRCPPDWLRDPQGPAIARDRYKHVLAIEPDAHSDVTETISPVLAVNPTELRPREALRERFGVTAHERLAVVMHAAPSEELNSLAPMHSAAKVVTLTLSGDGAMFPVAEWLTGADVIHCGAGYNSFWESRWLGYSERTVHTPFGRPIDDQSWRCRVHAQTPVTENGADELARRIRALTATHRVGWQPDRTSDASRLDVSNDGTATASDSLRVMPDTNASPFAALISPFQPSDFVRHTLGRDFRHWPGEPRRASHLVGTQDLERLAMAAPGERRNVYFLDRGSRVDGGRIFRTDSGHVSVRRKEWDALLRRGAVLCVEGVDRTVDAIRRLGEDLEWYVRATITATACATLAQGDEAPTQRDGEDVIRVQVAGRSILSVYGQGVRDSSRSASRAPFVGTPENAPGTDAMWDDVVEEGDTVYVPRGVWTRFGAMETPSVVVEFRWANARGQDFGAWLGGRLRMRVAGREAVPWAASRAELLRWLDRLKADLTAMVTTDSLDRYLRERDRLAPARSWDTLAAFGSHGHTDSAASTRFESRARLPTRPVRIEGKSVVEWPVNGGYWTYPEEYESLLVALSERREWSPADLFAASRLADRDAFDRAIAQLIEDGMVTVVSDRR